MNKLFFDLSSKNPDIKYRAQRAILKLSATNPASLYKDFDFFVDLLSNPNNIFVWTGLLVLGNLSVVDKPHRIDSVLDQIISKLNTGKMITAGNTIKSLICIAKSRPDLTNRIGREIIRVKDYTYDTEECKNILLGLLFAIMPQIWESLDEEIRQQYTELAKANLKNPRNATAKKAERFLKRSKLFLLAY